MGEPFGSISYRTEEDVNVLGQRVPARPGDLQALRNRRAVVGLSLVGMASMATTGLLQAGVIRHLPDPPLKGFNSDKVNLSKTAFPLGIPDGTLALVSFALNLPHAGYGGADRARTVSWVPLLAGAKALGGCRGGRLVLLPDAHPREGVVRLLPHRGAGQLRHPGALAAGGQACARFGSDWLVAARYGCD